MNMEIHHADVPGIPSTLKTDDPEPATFCALCLRERPPDGEFYEYSSANAFQFRDTLKRTIDLDLNLEEFDICTPCWKLLQLVEDFRLCCTSAACWAEQNGVGIKSDNSEEWFSGRVVQTIESVRAAIHDQVTSIDRRGAAADDAIVSEMSIDEIKVEPMAVVEDVKLPMDAEVEEAEEAVESSTPPVMAGDQELDVFKCTLCGTCFDSRSGLHVHMRRCWTIDKPPGMQHTCTVCGATFMKKSLHKAHMNRHEGSNVEKKIKNVPSYTPETLQFVVDKIKNGEITLYKACKIYGIPRTTLQFRLSDKCKRNDKVDPTTALAAEEELRKHVEKHGKKELTYTNETLLSVVERIKRGEISIYGASREHGIPRSTLQFRLSKKCKQRNKTGPSTILSAEEENKLVEWIFEMQRRGFTVTSRGIQDMVAYSDKVSRNPEIFKNGNPSKTWVEGFLERHPSVTVPTRAEVTAARARASELDLRGWFSNVLSYAVSEGFTEALQDPRRKLHGAELYFHGMEKGQTWHLNMAGPGTSKSNMTVFLCFSADGEILPPDVVLPFGTIPSNVMRSFRKDWGLGTSTGGRMDTNNFVNYIQNILHPALVRKGVTFPVILFVDAYRTNAAFATAETCLKLGIVLLALYPNTNNIIQPAEEGCFGPLKESWYKVLKEKKNRCVSMKTFAPLLQSAMDRALNSEIIKESFKACGLDPFDPDAPNYEKCPDHSQTEPTQSCASPQSSCSIDETKFIPADFLYEYEPANGSQTVPNDDENEAKPALLNTGNESDLANRT